MALFMVAKGNVAFIAVPTDRGGLADARLLGHAFTENNMEAEQEYPYQLCGRGNFFGEWELVHPHPRFTSVRAENWVEALVLPRASFMSLVTNLPWFSES